MAVSRRALRKRLEAACQTATDGQHAKALAAIKKELRRFPRSIYLMALERQVEQLREFPCDDKEVEVQRQDILESFPGLIEKATEHPEVTPETAPAASAPPARPAEREAAVKWLLSQYLQHAYTYLIKEEFSNALTEVQRMYILDPDNGQARDLEQRITRAMAKPTAKPTD